MRILTVAVAVTDIEPMPEYCICRTICVISHIPETFTRRDTVSLPISIITREEWELQGCE